MADGIMAIVTDHASHIGGALVAMRPIGHQGSHLHLQFKQWLEGCVHLHFHGIPLRNSWMKCVARAYCPARNSSNVAAD